MLTEKNFVSISELRDNTSKVVKDTKNIGKRIILSQNKPVGVFLSIDEYNALKKVSFETEVATVNDIKSYKNSSHWKDSVEAFSFLSDLK